MGFFDFIGGKKSTSTTNKKDAMSTFSNGPSLTPGASSSAGFSSPRDPFKTPPQRNTNNFNSQNPMNLSQNHSLQNIQGSQLNMNNSSFSGNNMNLQQGTSSTSSLSGSSGDELYNSRLSSMQTQQHPNPSSQNNHQNQYNNGNNLVMLNKNIEIIMSKLDAIRVAVENLDHRMTAMENGMQQKVNSNDYGKW